MALSFLSNVAGFLGKAGNAASTAQQIGGPLMDILGAIKGFNRKPVSAGPSDEDRYAQYILDMATNRQIPESERYAISMQKALAEPNNSLVGQLQGEEFQMLMDAINQGVQGKVLSDRREAAMGRRPTFFDPERQDENIAYQLTRGAPAAQYQARQNAMERIRQSATGVGGFAGAQDSRYDKSLNAYGKDFLRQYGPDARPQPQAQYSAPRNKLDAASQTLGGVSKGVQQLLDITKRYSRGTDFNPNASRIEPYGPYQPQNISRLPNGEQIFWNQKRYS
jgi:hypothetical protein